MAPSVVTDALFPCFSFSKAYLKLIFALIETFKVGVYEKSKEIGIGHVIGLILDVLNLDDRVRCKPLQNRPR